MAHVRGLTPNQLNQFGEALIAEINAALAIPDDAWPGVTHKERLTPQQECLADTLMAYLRLLAQQNQISPASLGTRKDIEKLVRGKRDIPLLPGRQLVTESDQRQSRVNCQVRKSYRDLH